MTPRYARTAIILHWLVAGLMVLQFPLGWLMQEFARDPASLRTDAFDLHKSIGLVLMAIVVARLAWRLSHPVSALEGPAWQQRLASATHGMLYLLLVAMAVSGYLSSVYGGRPIVFFGLPIASWAAASHDLKELMDDIHLVASWTLLATFAVHLAGAISHRAALGSLAGRMRPGQALSGFSKGT